MADPAAPRAKSSLTALRPAGSAAAPAPIAQRFGRFELQPDERRLLVDGEPAALRARALDVLIVLAGRAGQLVSRRELLDLVWDGRVVEENNLSVQINALRKVLGGEIVATVPGRGYRFVAPAVPGRAGGAVSHLHAVAGAAPTAPALVTNLPAVLQPLIGREADLLALAALVDGHALVSVVGAAGLGKTRLAQALLHTHRAWYPQGVCFVDLSTLSAQATVASLVGAVAAALGLPQPSGPQPVQALVDTLAPLALLVALDNAEHVVDAVAELAAALVAGAPRLRLLVTSQLPLRVPGERLHRLGAMQLPPGPVDAATALGFGAVALFVERAQALDTRFALTEANVPLVIELCRRLDGSPLAIEFAAARVPQLGLKQLLASLDRRLRLLTVGHRHAVARHQTLRAALDWSHGLLGPAEQVVFRRLSVFVGSASLHAAQLALADDPTTGGLDGFDVLDALGTLVDRSLVELIDGPGGADDAPRYRLLDTPLAFARERLLAAGEGAAVQRRHALALRDQLDQARDDLYEGRLLYPVWKEQNDPDRENGLAALQWALVHDHAAVLVMVPALTRGLFGRRHADCRAMWEAVEPVLDAAPADVPGTPARRARVAQECAKFWVNTRVGHALARARQAAEWALQAGDPTTRYLALAEAACCCGAANDLPGLRQTLADMAGLKDPAWAPFIDGDASDHEHWLCVLTGDHQGALAAIHSQARRSRAAGLGDAFQISTTVPVLLALGRADEAITLARQLGGKAAQARKRGMLRHHLNHLVRACLAKQGTPAELATARAEAREAGRDFWPLALLHDMQPRWADGMALLAALEQRPRSALRLIGYANAAFARAGTPRQATEQAFIARADQLARAALVGTADALAADRWQAEGAALPDAALPALAFDAED